MKKAISILCILSLLCIMLAACSSGGGEISPDSPYIGTWKAVKVALNGEETPIDEVLEEEMIIVFDQDGKITVTSGDGESSGTWSETKDGAKSTGDVKMSFTMEDEYLTTKLLGVMFYLEKQE